MEKLNNPSELNLIFRYALKDLSRNYKKLSSIIVTLFISLFILSAIFTIEDSLKKELNDNAKALLGGDLEIDYNRNKGNLELVDKVKEFATISQMIEFSTMVSTTNREKNKSLFTRIKTVDTKYPLYGDVNYEPADAFDRMHNEPNTLLINESLSKNLKLKINDKIKVQNQLFMPTPSGSRTMVAVSSKPRRRRSAACRRSLPRSALRCRSCSTPVSVRGPTSPGQSAAGPISSSPVDPSTSGSVHSVPTAPGTRTRSSTTAC